MTISTIGSLSMGPILKIISKGMVYDQLSVVSPLWDFVFGKKVGPAEGRQLNYEMLTTLGPAAVGFGSMNGAQFRASQKARVNEGTAQYKKIMATIELENSIIELAQSDFSKYGEPVMIEMEKKGIATARQLSMALERDGTGVIGTIASASVSGGLITVTLNATSAARGFVGWFDLDDKVVCYTTAAVDHNSVNGGSAASYFMVVDKDRAANQVVLQAFNSSDAPITVTSLSGADLAALDVLYRFGATAINLTAIISTTEFSTLSDEILGLEILLTNSALTVDNIARGSRVKGSVKDCNGLPLDSSHFQSVMSVIANNTGMIHKYKSAWMNTESYDALVSSRETDRRFGSVEDSDRGTKGMGYQYGDQRILFKTDEFCRNNRIWILPEGDVLQFFGSDIEPVKAQSGSEWHLKSGSGTHYDVSQCYLSGIGVLLCMQPSACGVIKNFIV